MIRALLDALHVLRDEVRLATAIYRSTKEAMRKVKEPTRATVGECLPSEIVELADETLEGGTMYRRTLRAGTRVMVSWHSRERTFVQVWTGEGWSDLKTIPAEARVGKVIVQKVAKPRDPGADQDVDPLTRATRNLPLWRN